MRTATLSELLGQLRVFEKLESIKATVNLQLSYVNEEQTKRRDLRDVRGFVLARRPGFARIQAQYPVTRQKAFDMASDGESFQVYLVWQGRFFTGDNDMDRPSKKRTENIRPQHVVEPLLIEPPRADETAVLDNVTESRTLYHVVQLQHEHDGTAEITRKFWFDRRTLQLSRLEIYGPGAVTSTVARYYGWRTDGPIPYPAGVTVSRPIEGYNLALEFLEPGLNEELPENAFLLEAPKGVKVEVIGQDGEAHAQSAEAK